MFILIVICFIKNNLINNSHEACHVIQITFFITLIFNILVFIYNEIEYCKGFV